MTIFKRIAAVVMVLGLAACISSTPQEPARFHLLDQNNNPVSAKPFDNKLSLVFFGYTYCPDICPTGLQVFAQAMDILGEDASKIQPVFVTIDPERDSPEIMAEYVANFHDDLIGITGSNEQIEAFASIYEAEYSKAFYKDDDEPNGLGYLMNHTGWIYLVGPNGFMTPEENLLELWGHGITGDELANGIGQFIIR